jgi:hypothetical protein
VEHFFDEPGLEELLQLYFDRPVPLFVKGRSRCCTARE